jgi:hypothetical protein
MYADAVCLSSPCSLTAKRQYIVHGILKAFKTGFETVILVEPARTTSSEEHDKGLGGRGA